MRVGVIGIKNQAAKIINYLARLEYVDNIIVYYPRHVGRPRYIFEQGVDRNILVTNNFIDILKAQAVFIASPSQTHVKYIKKILTSNAYIFCEKPLAISWDDVDYLEGLSERHRARINANFNMVFGDFSSALKRFKSSGQIGIPIHLSITSTHGLSYKKSYVDNWRFNDMNPFSNIFGNVGIHYIHLFESIFGAVKKFNFTSINFNKQVICPDTVAINLSNHDCITASIFLSYSAPFQKSFQCIFTDGILFDRDGVIEIQRPRDSFDEAGNFVAAKRNFLLEDNCKNSLERSIDYFFQVVLENGQFKNNDFELAVNASKRILVMWEGQL